MSDDKIEAEARAIAAVSIYGRATVTDIAVDAARAGIRAGMAMGEAERARFMDAARNAGVCMACVLQAPEPYGCTDCLNTGLEGGGQTIVCEALADARKIADHDKKLWLDAEERVKERDDMLASAKRDIAQLEEFIGRREDDILSISRDRDALNVERDQLIDKNAELKEACIEAANGIEPEILINAGLSENAVSIYCRARVDAVKAISARIAELEKEPRQ